MANVLTTDKQIASVSALPTPRPVGRPRLHEAHAKSSILPVRFNMKDRERVEQAAKAKGVSVSEWVRNTLLKAAAK